MERDPRSTDTPRPIPAARTIATLGIVVLMLTGGLAAGLGDARAQPASGGDPDLEAYTPDPELTPGSTSTLTVQIANDATTRYSSPPERERVTTARNVRIQLDAGDAPVIVKTAEHSVGSITENEPRSVPFAVEVPEDAEPGTYEVDVEMTYSYTSFRRSGTGENERTYTVTDTVDIEIDDGPQFRLTTADDDRLQVGETGPVAVSVENVGGETARDIVVSLTSQSSMLGFDGQQSDVARIDELAPGETANVTYEASVKPGAPVRQYALGGTVTYADPRGLDGRDADGEVGVEPMPEQNFSLERVDSSLRVDQDGDIRLRVTNNGPRTATDVSLDFAREYPTLRLLEGSVSAGTLEPDESVVVRLPIAVTRDAEAVQKSLDIRVQYRTTDDEQRHDGDVSLVAPIDPRRDDFLVSVSDPAVGADSSRLITVEVTNNRDQTLTDIEASLGTSDPLDSDDDDGYIASLDPGESTTLTFELSATSDANPKMYAANIDFRYDDESDKSRMSDAYQIPIRVESGDDGGLLSVFSIAGVGLLGALLGAAAYVYRRNDRQWGN